MQPVRQQAHCVTASLAKKPADPDENPAHFNEPADLAGIHAVTNNPEFSFGIPGCLPANSTMTGTKMFKARRVRTLGA
jgi:hypothetical protein